jgi:hypothetical protein
MADSAMKSLATNPSRKSTTAGKPDINKRSHPNLFRNIDQLLIQGLSVMIVMPFL